MHPDHVVADIPDTHDDLRLEHCPETESEADYLMQPAKVDNYHQHHTDPEELDEQVPQIAGFDCAGQI